jgi:hypothetical protein
LRTIAGAAKPAHSHATKIAISRLITPFTIVPSMKSSI